MDHSNVAAAIWRHRDLRAAARDYVALVQQATLAASSHNTQPWQFKIEPGRISILPDLSRRCSQVDPDDHHLYGSLGCAAENLLLAAQTAGLKGHLSYEESKSSLRIDLEHAAPSRSPLAEAIPGRQCSRAEYDGGSLPADQLRSLEQAGTGDGVSALLLTSTTQKKQMAEYVAAGNMAQFADPRWVAEMKRWIRFNSREAARTGDGLYGAAMGFPDVPRWLGKLVLTVASSARSQNRKDRAHIDSSPLIVVLFSEANDRRHWIEAGRCYERLALQATVLGLRTAFINQPVEVPALRRQLAAFVGIGDRRPDLIVRIGRGPEMPRSFRRPVTSVLL